MKKIVILVAFLIFSAVASIAFAHPPSDIKIIFDSKTKMLEAVIMHNTSNPATHYIKKIDIGLNGAEIIEHIVSREDNNGSQTVKYLIPDAKDGDVISVEGYCNLSGKLKKDIAVKF
ncbi:MAG: hypothetical protein WC389_21455 [Lutibacter sp.]|jgi:hypothetical protein